MGRIKSDGGVCCGDILIDGEVLIGVWDTSDGVLFVPLPRTNVVVLQRRLARGGMEPLEGAGKMGTAGKYIWNGGSG